MKTLIKIIIFLFLTAILCLYILIPSIGLGMRTVLSWYLSWFYISHCIVGMIIFIVPLIYIFNWIDKNIK